MKAYRSIRAVVIASASNRPERWELYRLLAEPARLRLLALTSEDELAVSELAELLRESQPNVSRHAQPLRQAGLLTVRRQGTWTLMRLAEGAIDDAVVGDALRTGRSLCESDGTLARVADVVRAREAGTREFFARAKGDRVAPGPPSEIAAYLMALAPLMSSRALAVDVGTGEGRLLEVLAPVFEHVVAVDRSDAQLALAHQRIETRAFANVTLLHAELDARELRGAVQEHGGADLVLAARVLHHAPRPAEAVKHLAVLARAGGAVAVIDYARHEHEAMRDAVADLWLGFEPDELVRFAKGAGLEDATVTRVPGAWCGNGPDRQLPWQVMVARKPRAHGTSSKKNGSDHPRTKRNAGV